MGDKPETLPPPKPKAAPKAKASAVHDKDGNLTRAVQLRRYEVKFDGPVNLMLKGSGDPVAHKLKAGEVLEVTRSQMSSLFGTKRLQMRTLDKDGTEAVPWTRGDADGAWNKVLEWNPPPKPKDEE